MLSSALIRICVTVENGSQLRRVGRSCRTFHEPHSGDTLHKATLCDFLRRLQLSPDEFVQLLRRR